VFATKQKLMTTLGAGALALGVATQASAAANQDVVPAPRGPRVQVLTDVKGPARAATKARARGQQTAGSQSGTAAGGFASPESFGVSQSTLDSIAACESGGDPTAVSPDGTYRGKYQFDYGTWESVGGSGDPAAAPEAEQDMRAAMLLSRAGTSPWPICG
jgi:soluble lytic murein transglycosylase-like protein